MDVLNADFSSSATDGGADAGFSLNGLAVSGKIGYQSEKVVAKVGGSAGIQTGGEVKLDLDKGIFIFDVSFILGVRIEANWKRDKK